MLAVRDLSKRLGGFAMRGVSFDVPDGGYFVLLGASGVGKTVVLETLAGIVRADSGQILLDGEDVTWRRPQNRRMAMVYQNHALFPHMTVAQNIAFPLRARRRSRRHTRERVSELAGALGVSALLHRFPGSLSGGEAQRVAVARTLAAEPRCLLLDEPMNSLDMKAKGEVRRLLRGLHREGHTVVHVTHDYEEAVSLATHIGVMEGGTVVQAGTPQEVLHHPASEFVARFIGVPNFFEGRLEGGAGSDAGLKQFVTAGLAFEILTDAAPGPGCLVFRSEDVTISRARPDGSARNAFLGTVVDLAPARLGVELLIDMGVEVGVLVTMGSVERLELRCGQKVWISIKATAMRFIEA